MLRRVCLPACLAGCLQGNSGACQQLLARGSSLNAADPALYQARGIVEKEARRYDAARSLFKQGLGVDSRHLHLWQVSGQQGWGGGGSHPCCWGQLRNCYGCA